MPNTNLSGVTFDPARRTTPATEKAVKGQKKSHQGGYVFTIDDMERARRFLILGSEDSFYQAGSKLSMENAKVIRKIAKSDKAYELVDLIVDISVNGRAPKQSPGLFALALVIGLTEDDQVKNYAYQQLSQVARTASTLFEFVSYLSQFQQLGGMGFQKAIGRWYNEKPLDKLAYQMVKYRSRHGFDHARLLRLSKRVQSKNRPELAPLLDWALTGQIRADEYYKTPKIVQGFAQAQVIKTGLPDVIREYGLSWEMIPTERLNDVKVWDALLDGNVPLGALIRQLPRLTKLGIIANLGGRTAEIEDRLTDREALKKARIHPIQALSAMRVYARGFGRSSEWDPVSRIVGALEEAFYRSFDVVEPTGKRLYLGLDVSASMASPNVSEDIPLTPREVAAVMAMVVARTEPEHYFGAFQDRIVPINITTKDSLQSVVEILRNFPFAGTNLSLPMLDAAQRGMSVDAFVLFTDNENGLGRTHPFQALDKYRRVYGIQSKIIVNAVTATKFSMADPSDKLALDIAGFDTAAPSLIAEFIR